MKVYQSIAAVAAELATTGISKSRENKSQGFKFRGIDETLNALAPLLAKHGLVVLPRLISREMTERQNKSGGALFSVVVHAEFDFVSAEDGSKHTVSTYGEAMDSGDKATNKAMSIAYKYAAFLAFCIPVEAMAVDADETVHDVAPKEPDGYRAWVEELSDKNDGGILQFRAEYKRSPRQFREWLETHERGMLDAMVARAKAEFEE